MAFSSHAVSAGPVQKFGTERGVAVPRRSSLLAGRFRAVVLPEVEEALSCATGAGWGTAVTGEAAPAGALLSRRGSWTLGALAAHAPLEMRTRAAAAAVRRLVSMRFMWVFLLEGAVIRKSI
jgi:hypothetical protein